MSLRDLRISRGLTQEQVARQIDVTLATYRNHECKRNIPKLDTAKKLSDIFSMSIDEFYKIIKDQ